jgi:gluconokinase
MSAAKGVVGVVVMGVAGCGKSAVGQQLADLLGLPLIEGDDFHPPANVQKMQQGIPLNDDDRNGWLQSLAQALVQHGSGAVLTCSALKASYRDALRQGESLRRVAQRADHFYPPSLVQSQFDALQDPAGEPLVLVLDGSQSLQDLAQAAAIWVNASVPA